MTRHVLTIGIAAMAGCAARTSAPTLVTFEVRNQSADPVVAKIVRRGALDTNSWLRSSLVPPGQSRAMPLDDAAAVDLVVSVEGAPPTRVAVDPKSPVLIVSRSGASAPRVEAATKGATK